MTKWKTDGVRVIKSDDLDTNTAQTPGMNRASAINFARVGAEKLWAGTVDVQPNAKTGAHHHGHLGGFNQSSQHLDKGVCDDYSKATLGSVRA